MSPSGEEAQLLDCSLGSFWLVEEVAINLCDLIGGEDQTAWRTEWHCSTCFLCRQSHHHLFGGEPAPMPGGFVQLRVYRKERQTEPCEEFRAPGRGGCQNESRAHQKKWGARLAEGPREILRQVLLVTLDGAPADF